MGRWGSGLVRLQTQLGDELLGPEKEGGKEVKGRSHDMGRWG